MQALTLFACPRAFEGDVGRRQENALGSWTRLQPRPQILLASDDAGVAEAARRHRVTHLPSVRTNQHGTPLLSDIFEKAHQAAENPLLVYSNADIVLLDDFTGAMNEAARLEQFLMIGRRTELELPALEFEPGWQDALRARAAEHGRLAAAVCKDYFAFPTGLFRELPDFCVGRGNWDNWMVYEAHRRGLPVIDASGQVLALHQPHDYAHVPGGRWAAYVGGAEARANARAGGGSNLVKGSSANWELTGQGPRPRANTPLKDFIQDSSKLSKLLWDLVNDQGS